MTIIHVDSNASGLNDGTSWVDAYTTVAAAAAVAIAYDKIYAASDHYEIKGGSTSIALASTVELLSVNKTTNASEVGATIDADEGTYDMLFTGANGKIYGFNLLVGDDFILSTNSAFKFTNCYFRSTSVHAIFTVAGLNGTTEFHNCTIDLYNSASRIIKVLDTGSCSFYNTKFISLGQLLDFPGGINSAFFYSCDISEVTGASSLVGAASMDRKILEFYRCLMPPNTTGWYSAPVYSNVHISIKLISCTSMDFLGINDDNNAYWYEAGITNNRVVSSDDLIYLNATYDGTNGVSLRIESDADTSELNPVRYKLLEIAAQDLTSANTFKINILTDNITLTDADFWIEIVTPDNINSALGSLTSNRNSDILSAAVDLTTNSEAWVESLGTPIKQEVVITAPVLNNIDNGVVELWVNLVRANTTVWADQLAIKS